MLRKRMLQGCWLLTDLDGTLVPTPHNARGEYLSLDRGPCFQSIRRWLWHGGNVCVITTADRRVFDQVHVPLRRFYKPVCPNDGGALMIDKKGEEGVREEGDGGNVLLSLYTGAVMYRCSIRGIDDEVGYSKHIGPSQQLSQQHLFSTTDPLSSVSLGTCLAPPQAEIVCDIIAGVFIEYATAVLRGDAEAVASQHWLSLRYQRLWSNLLKFLTKKYEAAKASAGPSEQKSVSQLAEFLEDPVEWKIRYLSGRKHLLGSIGIIRKEREYSADEINAVYTKGTTAEGKTEFSHEAPASFEHFDHHQQQQQLRQKLQRDPSVSSSISSPSDHRQIEHGVAQVIIVGMPLRLYGKYFKPHEEEFRRLGVTPIAQPNSVVFSRSGVSKSTAVQYLDRLSQQRHHHRIGTFQGLADLQRCVALGDNPNAADHELTVFPSLRFVSCEHHKQRAKRHTEIESRRASPSCSSVFHDARQTWDDRVHSNIEYVGGEEHGTSLFLGYLMDYLNVPKTTSKEEEEEGGRVGGAPAATKDCNASDAGPVTNAMFQAAVTDASHRARSDVHGLISSATIMSKV